MSPQGQRAKAKINLERCVYWDSNGKPAPQPLEFARRRGAPWLMGRQFGVLFCRSALLPVHLLLIHESREEGEDGLT